jgi:hypothetical protein
VFGLAACNSASNGPQLVSAPQTTASKASPTPSPTPTRAKPQKVVLPADCDGVLSVANVSHALGKPVKGKTIFLRNVALPKIHRTGRVTCYYGVTSTISKSPVQAGMSAYSTAEAATSRLAITVAAERSAGANVLPIKIGDIPGTVLVGKAGALLVVAQGQRTIAISLAKGVGGADPQHALNMLGGDLLAQVQ